MCDREGRLNASSVLPDGSLQHSQGHSLNWTCHRCHQLSLLSPHHDEQQLEWVAECIKRLHSTSMQIVTHP